MGVAPEISTAEEEEEVVTWEEEEEEARRAHHRVGGVRPEEGRGVIDPPPPNVSLRNACLAHATTKDLRYILLINMLIRSIEDEETNSSVYIYIYMHDSAKTNRDRRRRLQVKGMVSKSENSRSAIVRQRKDFPSETFLIDSVIDLPYILTQLRTLN